MAAGQAGVTTDGTRRWRRVPTILAGAAICAGVAACGKTSFEVDYEFRVEGTVTGPAQAGAYAVVTGELYTGECGTGEPEQRSHVRAGQDGRYSVGFTIPFQGCLRVMAVGTSLTGMVDRTGVVAGGSGARLVQLDVPLAAN